MNQPNKRRQTPDQVSELTTNRLSVYLRCLNELAAGGVQTISSQALAEQFHLNAAQIRKDLAYFGEFGVRFLEFRAKGFRRMGSGSQAVPQMREPQPGRAAHT